MKEIFAVIRMNKSGATRRALVETGVVGFTAFKVMGRGKLVTDPTIIEERKRHLLALSGKYDPDTERRVTEFLDGTSLFPRRLFTILARDEDVEKIVDVIIGINRTELRVGDGKIFVLPVIEAVRVRTGETGDAAV